MTNDAPLHGVVPKLMERYLSVLGWKVDLFRTVRRFWLPGDDENDEVELFLAKDASPSSVDVQLALETLSELYGKSLGAIANEIRSLAFDVISSRIPDDYVKNDTIELGLAGKFIARMRNFIASSATAEISGQRVSKRILKEGKEYSENCRFGHTFRGSFGFIIESPVGLNNAPNLNLVEDGIPLGRRVTERITEGMGSYQNAISAEDPAEIVKNERGFSANMCDSLISLVEDMAVSRISFDVTMSPEWRPRKGNRESSFVIEAKHIDILKDAAKSLRVDEPPRDVKVVGRVKRLETEGNPSDLSEDTALREIEVSWVSEDDDIAHVRISVSPEQYLKAVEAHKVGKFIGVEGVLEKSGRIWRLRDPKDFRTVE